MHNDKPTHLWWRKLKHELDISWISQLLCPTRKNLGVSSPDRSIKFAVVFNVPYKRSWCTVELCPAWPTWNYVEQRPVPLHPGHPPFSQATGDSVYLKLPRRMNLDSVHSRAAQSGTCSSEQCMWILFFVSHPLILSFRTPPLPMVYPHSTDCCYFLGLIDRTME